MSESKDTIDIGVKALDRSGFSLTDNSGNSCTAKVILLTFNIFTPHTFTTISSARVSACCTARQTRAKGQYKPVILIHIY